MFDFAHFLSGSDACGRARPDCLSVRVEKCRTEPDAVPEASGRVSVRAHPSPRDDFKVGVREDAGSSVRLSGASASRRSYAFSARLYTGIAAAVAVAVVAVDAFAGGNELSQMMDNAEMYGVGLGAGVSTLGLMGVWMSIGLRQAHGIMGPSAVAFGAGGAIASAPQIVDKIITAAGGASVNLSSGFSVMDAISMLAGMLLA